MNATPPLVDRAAGLAPAARLLAAWWSRPTAEELGRWALGWEQAAQVAELIGAPREDVPALREAVEAAEPDALREEYERLLVGPGRTPCPPYESLWRPDPPRREQGRLLGEPAADVVRLYGELGLRLRGDAHELPDQLAVELEALAFALEQGATAAAAALARDHLARWVPAFAAAVEAETRGPFYAALARLTPSWTNALAA